MEIEPEERHWEEVNKDDKEITVKRSDGGKLQVENVRGVPELVVARSHMKKRDAGTEKKRKTACWSTKTLEETVNRQECEDTNGAVAKRY